MSGDYLTGNSRCPICSGHHPINAPCFLSTNWIPLEKTPMTPDIKELVRRLRTFKHRDANAAADALEALAGEVERLKEERDAAITDRFDAAADRITAVAAERDRLAGEVEQACGREQRALLQRDCATKEAEAWREERDRLKAALEPFAKLSTDRERQDPPEGTMRVRVVTAPEIEAARKALGGDA